MSLAVNEFSARCYVIKEGGAELGKGACLTAIKTEGLSYLVSCE